MSRVYPPVGQDTKDKYVGKVFKSNNYGDFIVLEFNAVEDVKIKFLNTGFIDTVFIHQVRTGRVRDYMQYLILSKGIIGAKLTSDERKHKAYKNWYRILSRCYDEKLRDKHPTYLGCTMSEYFLTYTNFKEWYVSQPYWDADGYVLDKDLLVKGNKVYSPETCCFIPTAINSLLTTTGKNRGKLPIGVRLAKGGVRYQSDIGKNGKNYYLGTYDTINEAFNSYKEAREGYYKEKAEEWRCALSKDAYIALRDRVVEITD